MKLLTILTPLGVALGLAVASLLPSSVFAQKAEDQVVADMAQAFRQGDRKRLAQLLPLASGHVLESWAAYWELKSRLSEASADELEVFFKRYAGSYQEDRLRNDWLLLLGQRRDWASFAAQYPKFRMADDRELRCYALLVEPVSAAMDPGQNAGQNMGQNAGQNMGEELRRNWYAQRDASDGCQLAAGRLLALQKISEPDIWRKARLAIEANRPRVARSAVELIAPELGGAVGELGENPVKFLHTKATAARGQSQLVVLALLKIASKDASAAADLMDGKWAAQLSQEERDWVWGSIGRQAAMKLSPSAPGYFAKVHQERNLGDDALGWKVRAALRAGDWGAVGPAIGAMSDEAQRDSTWVYWRARALLANRPTEAQRLEARKRFEEIAGVRGFYEQLALEELGQRITVPPKPAVLSAEERSAARQNQGLLRGLYAIRMGLRSEGTREWNYSTNLHQPGGMDDRALLAAADLACQQEVWDRCINTSERTKGVIDAAQRYPMPHHDSVLRRSREIGIDPAYVYGLIRQESRFIMDARSGVGASGLMQVMPATARWTAKKIGMSGFTLDQLHDRETNITIGTAYLKLALDDFDASLPLAAAAYNAGPGRPRNWRNGPQLEAAIWAENVPFSETRDYVKKVLANTTNYAALLSGQPQSLKARLGTVGPRAATQAEANPDLP